MTPFAAICLFVAVGLLISYVREHKWYDLVLAMLALMTMIASAFLPAIGPL